MIILQVSSFLEVKNSIRMQKFRPQRTFLKWASWIVLCGMRSARCLSDKIRKLSYIQRTVHSQWFLPFPLCLSLFFFIIRMYFSRPYIKLCIYMNTALPQGQVDLARTGLLKKTATPPLSVANNSFLVVSHGVCLISSCWSLPWIVP